MTEPAFVDTSVLVRYLTDDPPHLAERAARVIDTERPLLVSDIVLVETAYVLTTVYGIERDAVVESLQSLLLRHNLSTHGLSKGRALAALELCRGSHRVSFADAIQWAIARDSGQATVVTFDRRFPEEDVTVEVPF